MLGLKVGYLKGRQHLPVVILWRSGTKGVPSADKALVAQREFSCAASPVPR
jgi:hypothetical protein